MCNPIQLCRSRRSNRRRVEAESTHAPHGRQPPRRARCSPHSTLEGRRAPRAPWQFLTWRGVKAQGAATGMLGIQRHARDEAVDVAVVAAIDVAVVARDIDAITRGMWMRMCLPPTSSLSSSSSQPPPPVPQSRVVTLLHAGLARAPSARAASVSIAQPLSPPSAHARPRFPARHSRHTENRFKFKTN